jgi:hypothetical protein
MPKNSNKRRNQTSVAAPASAIAPHRPGRLISTGIGAGSTAFYIALAAWSYSAAVAGDMLAAGALLISAFIGIVIIFFFSEEYGAFRSKSRPELKLFFPIAVALLSCGIYSWEWFHQPPPPSSSLERNREPSPASVTTGDKIASALLHSELPGFSARLVIRMNETGKQERQYVFDQISSQGAETAFYLSASKQFTFLVRDIHHEPYTIEVGLGPDEIPLNQFIYLVCDIGVSSSASFLRVRVNGRDIQHRMLPFPVDLGDKVWTGTIGTDLTKQFFAKFDLAEYMIFRDTKNIEDDKKISDYIAHRYNLDMQY